MTELTAIPPRHSPGDVLNVFLRPVGDPGPGVSVQLELGGGRLTISGESVGALGTWDFEEVGVSDADGGAVISIDGEDLLVTFDDETLKMVLLDAFRSQPWWAVALPIVGGLAIAAMIWFVAA